MKKFILFFALIFSTQVYAAEQIFLGINELSLIKGKSLVLHREGASFIKVHFEKFYPQKGTIVEVSNIDGSESYTYFGTNRSNITVDLESEGFYSMSITGDTAIVTVKATLVKHRKSRVVIDYFIAGTEETPTIYPTLLVNSDYFCYPIYDCVQAVDLSNSELWLGDIKISGFDLLVWGFSKH